jgi:hypothetical protein
MRFSRLLSAAFVALGFSFTPANAQYITPQAAAPAGGACTNGTYAWPDSSGYLLQCVAGIWTKIAQAGTADYNGTSCTGTTFISGLDNNMQAICVTPDIYTILAGNTNNTATSVNSVYHTVVEGAMTPVTTTPTQGLNETVVSRSGTIQNMYVVANTANTAGKTVQYQIIDGTTNAQGPYCVLNGTSSCYDNQTVLPVNAGDQLYMQITTQTGDTTVKSSWSVELNYKGWDLSSEN